MNQVSEIKDLRFCSRCKTIVYFYEFYSRNSRFSIRKVMQFWKNEKRRVYCNNCYEANFQEQIAKMDRVFKPLSVILLVLCVAALAYFSFVIWGIENIIKPLMTPIVQIIFFGGGTLFAVVLFAWLRRIYGLK